MNKLTTAIAASGIIFSAQAGTLTLVSQAGLQTNRGTLTVAIEPDARWQSSNPFGSTAVWVAHSADFQPFMGMEPAVSIYTDFVSEAGMLSLSVWADDTAEVLLDDVQVFAPTFTQDICADQPIGCEPLEFGSISVPLTAGFHVLEFKLFQLGKGANSRTNPFGLMFSGAATWQDRQTETPEPGTWGLIGLTLIGLGVYGQRKRA